MSRSALREIRDGAVYALLLAIQWLMCALPHRAALAVGAAMGRCYARLRGPRMGVALANLEIAFPHWSCARRRRLLVANMASIGRSVIETGRLGRLSPARVRELVKIEGVGHLEAALRRSPSGGVVLLTAHLGSTELMLTACALLDLPVSIVHRTISNRHLDEMVTRQREGAGAQILRRGDDARGAIRALRAGRVVAFPLDQSAKYGEGVFVPFFSRQALTRDGPARIAMRTRSPVVPAFMSREADGVHHVVQILPEVPMEPAGADRDAAIWENVHRMTRVIEEAIRQHPEDWIWIHRRWKNQPKADEATSSPGL